MKKEKFRFYSSFMARKWLNGAKINLFQSRVSKLVFARHYLKDNICEFQSIAPEGKSKLETLLNHEMKIGTAIYLL